MKGDFAIKTFIKKSPLTPLFQRGEAPDSDVTEWLYIRLYSYEIIVIIEYYFWRWK